MNNDFNFYSPLEFRDMHDNTLDNTTNAYGKYGTHNLKLQYATQALLRKQNCTLSIYNL